MFFHSLLSFGCCAMCCSNCNCIQNSQTIAANNEQFFFFVVSVVVFGKFHFIHIKWNNNNNDEDDDEKKLTNSGNELTMRMCTRCTCWMNMFNVYNLIQKQNAEWKVLWSEFCFLACARTNTIKIVNEWEWERDQVCFYFFSLLNFSL